MATIKRVFWLPIYRHCQGEAHTHIVVTRKGKTSREGQGLGFWFNPVGTAISEVPVNDQSVTVNFKARSKDFQEVSIAAQVWYTVTDPSTIATRFDFSINTGTGAFNSDPLTTIQGALANSAQAAVWSYVSSHELEVLLQSALTGLSSTVSDALGGLDFGIQVTRAVVTAVRPEREVEQALQAKTLERLQMEADAASFERRAKATEQERAIQEAELANRLAIAKQREELITQQDANSRKEAATEAAVVRIHAESEAAAATIHAEQALTAKKASDVEELKHKTALAKMRSESEEQRLASYTGKEEAARAIAFASIPNGLSKLQVLTLGEGGFQAALERLVQQPKR